MPPKNIMDVVTEQFTDLNKDEVKQLVIRALQWFTSTGLTATKRIDAVCVDGKVTKPALIERRAQAIAFGLLAKTIAIKCGDEESQLAIVTDLLASIDGVANAIQV